jgi:hypothetical protein
MRRMTSKSSLKPSLLAPSFDPKKKYVDDRNATQTRIYMWVPKPFVLSDLLASRPAPPTMVGTIFRGHFERGGVAITADDVEARVERILYSRRLVPSDPPLAERRHVMFGSPSEPFHKAAGLRSGLGHRDRRAVCRLAGGLGGRRDHAQDRRHRSLAGHGAPRRRSGQRDAARRSGDRQRGADGAAGILSGDGRSRILAPYRF